jgi:hypothetical protein
MAEANPSIQQTLTAAHARITTAAVVLAQLRARQAVKQQLQRQGLKVSHFAAREITALASEYLAEHRAELMPDAIETIERWTLAGEFGKRAQRALAASRECSQSSTIPNTRGGAASTITREIQHDPSNANHSKPNTAPIAERCVSTKREEFELALIRTVSSAEFI